jgi:glucan biosynthesis protein C
VAETMNKSTDTRRYDIDWLRTLAFILLIFYHIGQFYVADWGWHVKSAYLSESLQNIMMLVNQWRMPLIFLVSGVALSLVETKIDRVTLFKMRFTRVLVPLVIGTFLIVPPQVYFEIIQSEGYDGSYFEFMKLYLDTNTTLYGDHQLLSNRTGFTFGLITYNHLWYLAYLFIFTLVYMAIKPLLVRIDWQDNTKNTSAITIFFVPVTLFVLYKFLLAPYFPETFAIVNDWYNHAFFFTCFMMGYILSKAPLIWQKIVENRKVWLISAVTNFSLFLLIVNDVLGAFLLSVGLDVPYIESLFITKLFIKVVISANMVSWLLTLIGFAGAYLNKKHPVLTYMNEAVLPWYILHQTLIIIFAMWLAKFKLGPVFEPVLLITFTFIGCAIGYEVIKRFVVTRFIFGLKIRGGALATSKIQDVK